MQTNVDNSSSPAGESAATPQPTRNETGRGVIDAKHEGHRRYTLIDKDDSEFSRTAEDLLEGTKLLSNRELLIANLAAVFRKIRAWCDERPQKIASAFITLRPGRASLFFVAAAARYDVELDAAMTDLEVELGGSAGIGPVESFQIPERSIDQFIGDDAVELWRRPAGGPAAAL